jgi:hypothetical protein
MRHSPKVCAECDSKVPPTSHGLEVWRRQQRRRRRGTARRWQQDVADSDEAQPGAATDAAQPEGMRRMNGRRRRGTDSRCALGPREEPPPMRHSPEVHAGTGSREAADEAPPRGVRSNRQQSRHRCGTARRYAPDVTARRRRRGTASRCALEPAAETPPMRHSPTVCAEYGSFQVCAGTGSRAAADAAQPEGMRRMWQQDAADEAQPRGVR